MRYFSLLGCLLLLTVVLSAERIKCPSPVTQLDLPKGEYSPLPGVTFALENFSAEMVARGKKSPYCFMRVTEIQHGEVFIDVQSLSREFASKLNETDTKIRDFRIETENTTVSLKGTIKKVIPVPFTLEGPVTTDGTRLFFHAQSVKAIGLPMKGLLGMLGKHLETMLKSENVGGVTVKKDTIIFEPEKIAHVRGRITSAQVTSKGLLVTFSGAEAKKRPLKR
jgi:hypothetical protein